MAQASDIVNSNWSPGKAMPGREPSVKMRTPLISEVLKKVNNAKTKPQKIKILREYDSPALRSLCKWSFDPNREPALPEGRPPFIPNDAPEGTEHTMLVSEARTLYHYIKGGNPQLTQNKREMMFVRLLEGLHENEAELLIAAKDKIVHRKYKGLSTNVVKEAFMWDDNFMVVEHEKYPAAPGPAAG